MAAPRASRQHYAMVIAFASPISALTVPDHACGMGIPPWTQIKMVVSPCDGEAGMALAVAPKNVRLTDDMNAAFMGPEPKRSRVGGLWQADS